MRAVAIAHPNVALIKYWGKRQAHGNLPATGSLSIVLGGLATETVVEFGTVPGADRVRLDGRDEPQTTERVTACLDSLRRAAGRTEAAIVHSRNDFPTGAGLASSASGFAALVTAAAAALELSMPVQELAAIARLGSGSAPRSLLGGVVLLTNEGDATRCEQLSAPADWPLHVVVAVTTSEKKEISSREGMAISARTSPFYPSWVESHAADLAAGRDSIRARDFTRLAELAEHNCLKMHAVMQSSRPPLVYWNPATVACLHAIRALRTAGVPVFFTIDAGPQVKAVCLPDARAQVTRELSAIPGVQRILQSPLGEGARLTSAGGSSA